MSHLNDNYSLLIRKLDEFIRKFYLNQIVRGILYSSAVILALFLLFNFLEYEFFFGKTVRKIIFFSFLFTSIASLSYWVIWPLSKYFKLGKVISHEEASRIIGSHFQDVNDKLLNILQLKKIEQQSEHRDLIIASIAQKSEQIKLVPFKAAIDLSKNKKYLRYALPPFLLLVVLLLAAPSMIKDSTYRIINNNKEFVKDAPFSFKVLNRDLKVIQFDNFDLNIEVDGSVQPNEVYVEIDNFFYKMQKKDSGIFSYTFRNVQKDLDFRLVSGKVQSLNYTLSVLAKSNLSDLSISLAYPPHTGRKNENFRNIGDLVIPEGTRVEWIFNTNNTDDVFIKFAEGESQTAERKSESKFFYRKQFRDNDTYKIFLSNKNMPNPDSISYTITVLKDQYPSISVEQFIDSLDLSTIYFVGNASDDYGLTSLTFNYYITSENGKQSPLYTETLKIDPGRNTAYQYQMNLAKLQLQPGDNLVYFFEVKDNDAVNGRKASRTDLFNYRKLTLKELNELEDKNDEEIKDNLEDSQADLEKLQRELQKIREKLLAKKEMDWQDKRQLESLIEEQKKALEKLEKAKEKFDENIKNQQEKEPLDPDLQEKQDKLNQLFEESIDPERQELMDKIMDLIQQLEKEDAIQMLDQMQMNNENMKNQMERLMELYKQLEFEKDMRDQIKALEELAEKQEDLAKEAENKESDIQELKEQQEQLNEEFEDIKDKLEELEKKNKELSPPKDLGNENKEKSDDIQKDMSKAKDKLDSGAKQDAAKSQKSAAKKMKKMAGDLQSSMDASAQEQHMEDIKTIRQLLENLVNLSFDQESLINEFSIVQPSAPKYVQLIQKQNKLQDDFKMIEDSLIELSKRVVEIESFVMEKVTEIKYNLNESKELLVDRKPSMGIERQRRTMTYVNDLALMLSESMNNMQQQAASSMPGNQMCQKPGGKGAKPGKSKVPLDKITEGQQGLSDDLKGMQDKMKNGENPSAKDFAQAAARQAALRKALQELQQERQEQGKGAGGFQDIIDQMDKIETQLVNKRLDAEVLKRQQNIITRLLEAEKADRQREWDEKRKSETAREIKKELPPALQEYLKSREAEVELYKPVSPSLKEYYRRLVDEYYKSLKREI